MEKNTVAMILAGGRGTRLESLTEKVAKPAVYYGGKYRIIDFVLSNCVNSGINKVGVLTQYESVSLGTYIGTGQKWGLDNRDCFATILPARQTNQSDNAWYEGTANAIYQNLNYIEHHKAKYVVVLSGDHIYKMDYNKMLESHIEKDAEVSIAVLDVGLEEASRFGILQCDANGSIESFREKPKNPTSSLASMGIYIFNYDVLKEYLTKDAFNPVSQHDFGHDIIPLMLQEKIKLFAYRFEGYWKDVGTIDSLWQANMDLLEDKSIDLYEGHDTWKIYSEDHHVRPQYLDSDAQVKNSIVGKGCYINGVVEKCVLFDDVIIEKGAVVHNSVLMPGCVVKSNAYLNHVIVSSKEIVAGKNGFDDEKITLICSKEESFV